MSAEVELAAAASLGGWLRWRRKPVLPPGTPCRNCETPLQGQYCHACGQLGEDFERSIWKLAPEAFTEFFQIDGKFMRTLPALFLRPGKLTRDYIAGRRATQIPPLRMFFVVLVIVFLVGELTDRKGGGGFFKVNPPVGAGSKAGPGQPAVIVFRDEKGKSVTPNSAAAKWLQAHAEKAMKNPDRFRAIMGEWLHRFAVLTLPISALILSLIFVFQRRFYFFDHLIFSMHSLSFQGLLLTPVMLSDAANILLLLSPVHLFFHMRGAYGTSVFGTLVRMSLLGVASIVAVTFLALGLVLVGLNAL